MSLHALTALSESNTAAWNWGYCIVCGSLDVTDRKFHIGLSFEILRAAWCASPECQKDHDVTYGPDVPKEWKE